MQYSFPQRSRYLLPLPLIRRWAVRKSLNNLWVAKINKLDSKVEDGKVTAFRARVGLNRASHSL